MAYTARDALKFSYIYLSQHWATRALWTNNFMYALNTALNHIYNYEWYIRSWQHVKDAFNITWKKHMRLVTRRPIQTVDKFWTWQWKDVEWSIAPCYCPDMEDDETCCACECPCPPVCEDLKMTRVSPQNQLCDYEYKIAWSEIKWMWWLNGRIIHINVPLTVSWLRVTYRRWVKHITSRDEIIPLPDNFMNVLWLAIAASCVPLYWIMMQQQDLNYWSLFRKELDYLKKQDNVFPQKVVFNESYPFSWEQNNLYATWQWKRVTP